MAERVLCSTKKSHGLQVEVNLRRKGMRHECQRAFRGFDQTPGTVGGELLGLHRLFLDNQATRTVILAWWPYPKIALLAYLWPKSTL